RYQWEALAALPATNDGAETLTRVTQATTGTYSPRSTTVKHAGTAAYRLTHPENAYTAERLTYAETFLVQAGGQMTFRSRLRFATENQVAKVQVTTDGGLNWVDVYTQPGATPSGQNSVPGESAFQLRTVSLAAFVGKHIQVRFNYEVEGGEFFPGTDASVGWYVDDVAFSQVLDASSGVVTAVTQGQASFQFTPPTAGRYMLSVRPLISGRSWAFSPPIEVNVQGPPVDITLLLSSQPAFVPGSASLDFQTVGVGTSGVQSLIIQNSGTENLTNLAVEIIGTHAADFTADSLAATTLVSGAQIEVPLTFTPQAVGARAAMLRVLSNDPDESPFLISLSGQGSTALTITVPPRSQVVKAGTTTTLSVTAGPDVQSYLWRKNNSVVLGATAASLSFLSTKLTDAGTYLVRVTGGLPVSFQDSTPANLGVVEDIEKTLALQEGKAVTLTAKAAGPDLRYEWKKVGGPALEDGPNVIGRLTKTLTLKGLLTAQSGTYVCEVKTGGSTATAGATTHLRIYHDVPIVVPVQNLDVGIVSGSFYHLIRTSDLVQKTPLSYSAKNLPPGLKINAKTGEITGIPTKPGTYEDVLLIAINAVGPGQSRQTIVIEPYPTGLAGAYVGLAERHPVINQRLGHRLDLAITALGQFSGNLTQGTIKMPFKGALDLVSGEAALPHGQVQIQPPGKPLPPPITLTFDVDFANHRLTQASVAVSGQQVPITGWHQKWSAKGPAASSFQGLHTFGLRLPLASGLTNDVDVPQGWGYGSFTPLADGKLIAVGRTADGEKFTCASLLGPAGEVLLYQALYTTPVKGSLLGQLALDPQILNNPDDNTLTGDLTWTRPANALASARTYKVGFGLPGTPVEDPVPLEAVGARHVLPLGATGVILNLQAGVQNGRVEFDFGGIETTSDNPDQDLNIAVKSKITPFDPASNPAATRLTAVVTTGLLSGSFTLTDAPSAGAKEIKRTVALQGLLIRDGVNYRGVGYFLLPELPTPGGTAATPILSGSLLLRPR
ncbi:MAG: choice-of-anchor D domain-containing protein, partial [Verrucomicrobiota bacterium]